MPALVRKDDRLRRVARREHGDGALVDAAFDFLPLAVQAAQGRCKLDGTRRVVRQEQFRCDIDLAHAPSGIDARRERIADGPGRDRPLLHGAFGHQRGNAHALRVGERL